MKNILIIDGLNFLIPLVYSTKFYLNSNLIDIYPTYKFLININILKFLYNIDEIIVIFEIGRDIRKKRISEIYKSNRIQTSQLIKINSDEKIYNTITENRKMLINIFSKSKIKEYVSLFIEADTIIYGIVKFLSENQNNKIYVLSNDTDLYQVFNNSFKNKNINIIKRNNFRKSNENEKKNENYIYYETLQPFFNIEDKKKILKQIFKIDDNNELTLVLNKIDKHIQDFNIKNFIVLFKAFCGDRSDNIINIKNFGIKSFIKILDVLCDITNGFNIDLFNNIEDILIKLQEKIINSDNKSLIKIINNLIDNIDLIKVNLKLIDLEYLFNSIDIKTYSQIKDLCFNDKKDIDVNDVLKYITEYEINSIEEWSNIILNNILLNKDIKNAIDKNIDNDINCIQKIIYSSNVKGI